MAKRGDVDVTEETNKIIEDTLAKEQQSERDINKFVYIFGVIGPLIALFQAVKIFSVQSAVGVSLLYWVSYLVVAAMWFGYGVYYKNKAIMFVYSLWIVVVVIILNGTYFYNLN